MKKIKSSFYIALLFLSAFSAWTVLVRTVDVKPIGPQCSRVGLAALNAGVHALTGVNMTLYTLTDWLGLVPIFTAFLFALLGLVQWVKGKDLSKVDKSILALGGFDLAVILSYLFFELVPINYRPVLIEDRLEVSYPSSTTLLVTCVMPAAIIQLNRMIKKQFIRWSSTLVIFAFTAFMVVGRLASGVHWVTDIIGGVLLSAGLVFAYYHTVLRCCEKSNNDTVSAGQIRQP